MPDSSIITTDRREQIIVLLQTRDNGLPEPVRRLHPTTAGFAHGAENRVRTCPDCLANGGPTVGCETCGGSGRLTHARAALLALADQQPDDDKTTDPYSRNEVKKFGADGSQHDRAYARDAEIQRLGQQLRAPYVSAADELADTKPWPWERERARMWKSFDYAALDAALEELRLVDDGAYKLLHSVYVYGWLDHSAVVEAACDRGLRFIDARMPGTIRSPGVEQDADAVKESLWHGKTERHEARRAERVQRVIRAHFVWGWSTAEIAAHEVLSQRRVQQILSGVQGAQAAVASGPAA